MLCASTKKIITIRGQKVILDRDIAELYGVKTKEINQAVKNNLEKFPEGYVLALNKDERTKVVKIFDHLDDSNVKIFLRFLDCYLLPRSCAEF
ncbi:MAG: ORF6N domain-containing protein [Leptospirales bacterium]|nr:ORF6N domain-containing protein [Leptospirales bacterium]